MAAHFPGTDSIGASSPVTFPVPSMKSGTSDTTTSPDCCSDLETFPIAPSVSVRLAPNTSFVYTLHAASSAEAQPSPSSRTGAARFSAGVSSALAQLACVAAGSTKIPSGVAIRSARIALGLRAADLAGCLDVSEASVSNWEREVSPSRAVQLLLFVAVQEAASGNPRPAAMLREFAVHGWRSPDAEFEISTQLRVVSKATESLQYWDLPDAETHPRCAQLNRVSVSPDGTRTELPLVGVLVADLADSSSQATRRDTSIHRSRAKAPSLSR